MVAHHLAGRDTQKVLHRLADVLHAGSGTILMQTVLVDESRHPAGNALNEQQLLTQQLGRLMLLRHILHHPHLHLHAFARMDALHPRAHPAHLPIGTAPAVLHVSAIGGTAGTIEHGPVFGQHPANGLLGIHPLLAWHTGNRTQARRPQQHGLARIFHPAPMARTRHGFHGVKHLGLLLQIALHLCQVALAGLQGSTQVFSLGGIAQSDEHAVVGHAARAHVPHQPQASTIAQHMAHIQRGPSARHARQLVDQRRAGQLVEHRARIGTIHMHRPQTRGAPCCGVRAEQHQAAIAQKTKLHQCHRHRIEQSLQAHIGGQGQRPLATRWQQGGQHFHGFHKPSPPRPGGANRVHASYLGAHGREYDKAQPGHETLVTNTAPGDTRMADCYDCSGKSCAHHHGHPMPGRTRPK